MPLWGMADDGARKIERPAVMVIDTSGQRTWRRACLVLVVSPLATSVTIPPARSADLETRSIRWPAGRGQ
jgi:hypothetical protein